MEQSVQERVDLFGKAVERFPVLEPLTHMDGADVMFSFEGKQFKISSLGYELAPPRKDEQAVLWGLWDITDKEHIVPVGFFSGLRTDNSVLFGRKEYVFSMRGVPNHKFNDLMNIHGIPTSYAVGMDADYTNAGRDRTDDSGKKVYFKLSYLFHSVVLATLEGVGVDQVTYAGDLTANPDSKPQFTTQSDGMMRQQPYASFYTRYANVISTEVKNAGNLKGYVTRIGTQLTGMQVSLLKQAFATATS